MLPNKSLSVISFGMAFNTLIGLGNIFGEIKPAAVTSHQSKTRTIPPTIPVMVDFFVDIVPPNFNKSFITTIVKNGAENPPQYVC